MLSVFHTNKLLFFDIDFFIKQGCLYYETEVHFQLNALESYSTICLEKLVLQRLDIYEKHSILNLWRRFILVKYAEKEDILALAKLAMQMWDSHTLPELEKDFSEIVGNQDAKCFIKYIENKPVGFAQCQLRYDYVEGTETSPVGYLEGIFIQEEFRHKGFAKELLLACEKWAKEKNCTEFASDCELDNGESFRFHMAMGFEEANRVICFKKEI